MRDTATPWAGTAANAAVVRNRTASDACALVDSIVQSTTNVFARSQAGALLPIDTLQRVVDRNRAQASACALADGFAYSVTEPALVTSGISMHIIPLGNGNLDSRYPRAYGDMLYIADGAAMSDGVVKTVWSASGLDKNLHIGHDLDGDIDSTYVYTPPVNSAPMWDGAPATLTFTQGTGGTYAFGPFASDPDADTLTFSLVGTAYSGISINATSGLLTVTAAAATAVRALTLRTADPDGLYADWTCTVTIEAAVTARANLFDDGFESFLIGDMMTNALYNFGGALGNTPTIVSSPTREGSRSMRAWINSGSSTRCEVYPAAGEVVGNPYLYRDVRGWGPRPYYYEFDTTHPDGVSATPAAIKPILTNGFWYGFSLYIPTLASGLYPSGNRRDILCQFHTERDPVDATKNPAVTLTYYEGYWRVSWRYDAAQAYDLSYDGSYSHDERDGVYAGCQQSLAWNETTGLNGGFDGDRGRWTDWVFNICWDFRAGSTAGKLNVWKNGQTVVRYTGPVGYNDILGPYQKVGCYPVVGQATAPARDIRVDAIRFADPAVGNYALVAPRGSR